jgi:type IX secretion system PorP/SprF family membrane protein
VLETELGLFSIGVAAGITQQSLDGNLLRTPDGDYEGPTILHNDPILPNTVVHGFAPLFHAGIYYAGGYFEAGVAVQGYTPGNIRLDNIEIKDRAAVNMFAEYFIDASPEFALYPAIFMISDLTQTQVSLAVRGEYKEFMTMGVGLRGYSGNTLDAVTIFGGLRVSENLRLIYAYDLALSALRQSTEGSHELMLRYNLNKVIGAGLPPPVIYSPRF